MSNVHGMIRSAVDLNERRGQEINAAIRFIEEQIKTEDTKRILHMSDAALNDAKQALVDLEAEQAKLGLNGARVESKFYSEGALGELNPTLKTVLDILKGISSVRGRDYRDWETDRKSTRLNSSHSAKSRMPSSA